MKDKLDRSVGLMKQDGYDIGRNPRDMSIADFEALGHGKMSPLRAIRLRCLDCCVGQAPEVRKCTAVECPSWPYRMGRNPFHASSSNMAKEEETGDE